MSNSAFKELFGECESSSVQSSECVNGAVQNSTCSGTPNTEKIVGKDKRFKTLLAFYLSVIVVCLTFLISVWHFNSNRFEEIPEVKSVTDIRVSSDDFIEETFLDRFILKFANSNYRVEGSGAFAYIYEDLENVDGVRKNGLISMGEGETYFKNGQVVLFDVDESFKVLWDDYNRKYILLKGEKQYFLITNSSDFYYRNYLGQHILEDLVHDYFKNKDFILQVDENTWTWEWFFHTPVEGGYKHEIKVEIVFDLDTEYISGIRLFDESSKVCVFEFEFEALNTDFDVFNELLDYERIDEDEFNLSF